MEWNISLASDKSFISYPSANLLSQQVDALGLASLKVKLAAISCLKFPVTLGQLKKYLGITEYHWQYILHYAIMLKPL